MRYLFSVILLISTVFFHNAGFAGERFALLIGNSSYKVGQLTNPQYDAADLGRKLQTLGFKTTVLINANRGQMEQAVGRLYQALRKNKENIGLFYFSGHGLQTEGQNYLVPIGAMSSVHSESQVKDRTISAQYVLGTLNDSNNAMNIVILDACRNNPFRSFTRTTEQGLSVMNSPPSVNGSLIAFSTAPGTVASDGHGRNSPYIKSLLKHIDKQKRPIELLLKDVRSDVKRMTHNKQLPWYNASIEGNFFFNEGKKNQAPPKRDKPQINNTPYKYTSGFSDFLTMNQQLSPAEFCGHYAETAVKQTARLRASNCTEKVEKPARWSLEIDSQRLWCRSVDKRRTRVESLKREEYLKRCRAN